MFVGLLSSSVVYKVIKILGVSGGETTFNFMLIWKLNVSGVNVFLVDSRYKLQISAQLDIGLLFKVYTVYSVRKNTGRNFVI